MRTRGQARKPRDNAITVALIGAAATVAAALIAALFTLLPDASNGAAQPSGSMSGASLTPTPSPSPEQQDASTLAGSTFDFNDEGWEVEDNADDGIPSFSKSGGNPGGYIREVDNKSGDGWFWMAPPKFLGDMTAAYGGSLRFDLRHPTPGVEDPDPNFDVYLDGGGLRLRIDIGALPPVDWKTYTVRVDESENWLRRDTNQRATSTDMKQVLQSLSELRIRGDYYGDPDFNDITHLDNVILRIP